MKHLLALFGWTIVIAAYAQPALPLTKLNVSAGAVIPIYNNSPFNKYQNNSGVQLQIGANLLKGELLLTTSTFNNKNELLTEYRSVLFSVGYALNIPVVKNTWLKPFLGFGAHYMMFEQNTLNTNNLRESELMYQAGISVQTKLYKKLHVQLGSLYSSTQTFHKQHQLFLQSGLMFYFDTPKKLQHLIN